MFRLFFFLLLLLFAAPVPGWAEQAIAPSSKPPSPSPARSKSLTQEIKTQRQTERLQAIQQEQAAGDQTRRQEISAQLEAKQADIAAIIHDRAFQEKERHADIRYLEEAAHAREMDRRQSGLWKETLQREAYQRKLTSQQEHDAYLKWQAQMRAEDHRAQLQAKAAEAREEALDTQWTKEQKALDRRIQEQRSAQDRMLQEAQTRESAQIRAEEQRITRQQSIERSPDAASENTTQLDILIKSATQGNAHAQYQLGMMYKEGTGTVLQDYRKALQWFYQAAQQSNAQAQLEMGLAYYTGQGVPQDIIAAYLWSQRAVLEGEARATEVREALALKMSPAQLAKAQSLVK